MRHSDQPKTSISLFGLLPVALGCLLLGYGGYLISRAWLPNYVEVPAVVVQSEVVRLKASHPRPDKIDYRFAYTYQWEGESYRSDRYAAGGRDAMLGVCQFQVGDTITARVDPDAPDVAVVSSELPSMALGMSLLGLLMITQSGLALWAGSNPAGVASRWSTRLGPVVGVTLVLGALGYLLRYTLAPAC